MIVELGRDLCGDVETAARREWLVTNGLGGYASGTVAGLPTRRYHGLLVAAMKPPGERMLLVSKFDEIVTYGDDVFELGATRWRDGTLAPSGFRFIERFRLEGTVPVWTFAFGDALLEKRIWMERGENTTYVTYTLVRASAPVELRVKAMSEARPHHELRHARAERTDIDRIDGGVRCAAPGAPPFVILSNASIIRDTHEWYLGVLYERERERGLDDVGDQLHVGNFTSNVAVGDTIAFTLSTRTDAAVAPRDAWERHGRAADDLLARWSSSRAGSERGGPAWIRQLVAAADQFVVDRALPDGTRTPTIVAGYPWFTDWGRDAMIALPGLLLRTGRLDVARGLLVAWGALEDGGMLPNTFPEDGAPPEYNTVDAGLLFIAAVHRYTQVAGDESLAVALFPRIDAIVRAYRDGTRFGIGMDGTDGLVFAGAPGVALTWMDARIGDVPVTPRVGKPIEINALWYHALCSTAELAALAGHDAAPYESLAARTAAGFARYWDESEARCFDVLDGPGRNDPSFRPNQIFAVSLEHRALPPARQRAVFDACARALLTSIGLRTLDANAPDYRGEYGGAPHVRDAVYHQGTVWPWLIGPFVAAALNVGIDGATVASYIEPFACALRAYGLGTLPEVAWGDPPHRPDGCIAQAWSVGAVLDAWAALTENGGSRAPQSPR